MLKPEGHANRVQSLSFSSDGEVLASAGASNVKLWTRVGHFKSQLSWRAEVVDVCACVCVCVWRTGRLLECLPLILALILPLILALVLALVLALILRLILRLILLRG